ncbi:leucine-rich repeat domain-containing protein, partial [Skeletonema marinoi]
SDDNKQPAVAPAAAAVCDDTTPIEDESSETMRDGRASNDNSGQSKNPADKDTVVNEDGVSEDVHGQEATSPQKETIAEEITDERIEATNINTAYEYEDPAVLDRAGAHDHDDSRTAVPGIMFIPGPGYTGTGIHTGYNSGSEDGDINEGEVIIQGFLPEDDPSRQRRSNHVGASESTREQRTRDGVQRLIDNAITLDDSAVRPIPFEEDGDEENNALEAAQSNSSGRDDDEVGKSDNRRWFLPLLGLLIAAVITLAIALPLSMRGKSENEAQDNAGSFNFADCLPGEVGVRFELAKSILSSITSLNLLEDEATPQGKAIRWIVCDDSISVQLLENQDPVSGNLPKQKHGFRLGGDAGEVQDETDGNFMLNDDQSPVDFMMVNIRIVNDLNGPLPAEIGYLMDCRSLMLENHLRLTGQLPQTMGNMTGLFSVALLFNGPKFGGELPSSLLRLKYLNTIQIQDNFGKNWSLPSNVRVGDDTQLERLILVRNSFAGNIPPWIAKLKQLQTLDLSKNNFHGAIPEAIGDLSSVKYFNLLRNNLTETIPSSLGTLSQIDALILGENALQGELPASIGNLSTLQLLDVGSNELTSTIPPSFAKLESLKYLVLESNRFNGTVDVLESMKNLTVLLTRSNSFSGSLPDGLFSGTSDNIVVDIGGNKFTGELPTSFAKRSNLVSLIGARNSFADNATQSSVCDNSTLLVMDCDACECCEVCCDGENDGVCDFQLDGRTVLGYDYGAWYQYGVRGADYFAEAGNELLSYTILY